LVSWLADEPWSDHPDCTCPVISTFVRSWNDALPDVERTILLRPLLPRLVGTRGSPKLEKNRALMAADWLIRINTPAWLKLAGLTVHAEALAALPKIVSLEQLPSISGPIEDARQAADAAWATARAAALDATRDAIWDAARDAAGDAARAAALDSAWDAARDATWDAARDAALDAIWAAALDSAWDAARDAAFKKLETTKQGLQQSAVGLLESMIEAKDRWS
jgi:hypothetical protein